jgi:hypothetical protein
VQGTIIASLHGAQAHCIYWSPRNQETRQACNIARPIFDETPGAGEDLNVDDGTARQTGGQTGRLAGWLAARSSRLVR